MDFRPKEVHFVKNSNGTSTRIETWNYDTIAGWELICDVFNLIIMTALFTLASPYLLILSISNFNGRFNITNVIGAIMSAIVVYEGFVGGILMLFLKILLPEPVLTFIVMINFIALIVHCFLALMGTFTHRFIVKWYDTERTRINAFIVIMVIVIGISKICTEKYITKGFVGRNMAENLENIRAEPGSMETSKK